MPSGIKERLSEILIKKGIISEEKLNQALQVQKDKGGSLGDILVSNGVIGQRDLLAILSQELGIPPISLSKYKIDPEISKFIPKKIAINYQIMPVSKMGNVLTVAMSDPLNVFALDDIKNVTGMEISPIITTADDVNAAIEQNYGSAATTAIEDLVKETNIELISMKKDDDGLSYDLKEAAVDTPVVKLTGAIVLDATKARASDILIEPMEDRLRIRYKIDGVFSEAQSLPRTIQSAMISRIKVMSNLNIAERRLPQDGRIMVTIEGKSVDLRISTLPTIFGESVVMRVLDRTTVSLSIDEVGMLDDTKKRIRTIIQKPNGIFLATGPTGCGKTTTLYGCMKEINKIEYKVITTEDPVEYDLKGVIQVPINAKIGLTFASSLRHILRQDPDIIMVGEIRDAETAQIAIQASLTGHLVFSTLHTNDASGTITRLIDMGVEPFLVTSTLEAVLAQRLVRKICTFCKEEYTPEPEIIADLGIKPEDIKSHKFYRGAGCVKCNNSGYKGRTGIYELLILNEKIRALVIERAHTALIKNAAIENGMKTLLQDGLEKINAGITSVEEVLKEAQTSVL